MTAKNKTRAGGNGDGLGDNGGQLLSNPNDTTNPQPIQQLMQQSERRMESDPARYAEHFDIWRSLFALKNGLPWPCPELVEGPGSE